MIHSWIVTICTLITILWCSSCLILGEDTVKDLYSGTKTELCEELKRGSIAGFISNQIAQAPGWVRTLKRCLVQLFLECHASLPNPSLLTQAGRLPPKSCVAILTHLTWTGVKGVCDRYIKTSDVSCYQWVSVWVGGPYILRVSALF